MTLPLPIPRMPDDHECGTFCNEETGIHCEVMWTNTSNQMITDYHMSELYQREFGLIVTDVEPAREAPDFNELAPESLEIFHMKGQGVIARTVGLIRHMTVRRTPKPTHAWLIYFGTPEDVKDAYERVDDETR